MRHVVCFQLVLVLSHVGVWGQADIDHWEAVVQDGTFWSYLLPDRTALTFLVGRHLQRRDVAGGTRWIWLWRRRRRDRGPAHLQHLPPSHV